MSVEDLICSLFNSEMYEFEIGGVRYTKPGNIPKALLTHNVQHFEFHVSNESSNLYTMTICIVGFMENMITNNIMKSAFSSEQVNLMLKSGASLSSITDLTLSLDSSVELLTKYRYREGQVRNLVYNAYADALRRDLNIIIGGK